MICSTQEAEAGLALLDGTYTGQKKNYKKKALAKAKEALEEAQETKSEAKEAQEATKLTDDTMKVGFQVDLEKAKQAQETTKGVMTAAMSLMFTFYSNLLSPESKDAWNKIGISMEGPRELSRKSFNDCIMFHLLTAFPINAAEQEKYYISNVLRSPSASTYVSSYVV
jgi:hypothetical protein